MLRRFCALRPILVAFGAGLLLAAIVPAGFILLLIGVGVVIAGLCLPKR
jgi:hypothetical protein